MLAWSWLTTRRACASTFTMGSYDPASPMTDGGMPLVQRQGASLKAGSGGERGLFVGRGSVVAKLVSSG